VRKCGGFLVIVATFLGFLFVRRQLIKASDSSVTKPSKGNTASRVTLYMSPGIAGMSEFGPNGDNRKNAGSGSESDRIADGADEQRLSIPQVV
jgi:hypothetical protein